MSVYLIAELTIHDRIEYGHYESEFMGVFRRYRGEVLAVEDDPVVLEGEWTHTRTVLLRFPDAEEAARWYRSAEYEAIARHRRKGTAGNVVLLGGRYVFTGKG
jgi:uncharacterized protein (DUF1330 family)